MSLRLWDERVLPRLVDASLRGHEIGEVRAQVCTGLAGRVLEIGFGSGLNVRWYPDAVTSVTAVEPSDVGWQISERRRECSRVPIERGGLDGQLLEMPDDSHDCALITFSLCTIPDPVLALREARRVVRRGGRLHVLEHGVSPQERVRRWQRRLEPVQRALAGGCHLTRDIPGLVAGSGWDVEELREDCLPSPRAGRAWTYGYALTAR